MSAVIEHRQPMEPIPTSVEPQLQKLNEVRSVIFDVYGTLVVSGSGDVGSVDATTHDDRLNDALNAVGMSPSKTISVAKLHAQVHEMNDARKNGSIIVLDYEGNEIKRYTLTAAWPKTLEIGSLKAGDTNVLTEKLTVVYEEMKPE